MTPDSSLVRRLVDHANQAYDQVAALFYDAKMRSTGAAIPFINVARPPGAGQSYKETIALLEPVIRSRNPEWLKHPDGPMLIPDRLRNARIKWSPDKSLLTEDPAVVVDRYQERAGRAARHLASVLQRDDLSRDLESGGQARDAAIGTLLSSDSVDEALVKEQAAEDRRARSAAEERLDAERTASQDPTSGLGQDLGRGEQRSTPPDAGREGLV